jgi:large conductance mechanosensitive channel
MGWIKEFKDFASRGNLVDVAVAFVMGGAFGKVVTSFTNGIVAPVITLVTGGVDFSKKELVLKAAQPVMNDKGEIESTIEAVTLKWGALLTAAIDFIIVAFAMFMVVKAINSIRKKQEEAPAGPSSTDQLLMEIRDALKK